MRTPREAIADILGRIVPLSGTEEVALRDARGRILAAPVRSDVDLPPFEKSAMDGYAVRSADFAGAGEGEERELRYAGESRAGEPWSGGSLAAGACVAIYTGAELPSDCDAVVMVEETRREDDRVWLKGPVAAAQHVNHRGEVLAVDGEVAAPGRRLSAVDLAVLAAVGCDPAPVHRRPRVTILTTGDELVPAGSKPGPGQIREGNTLYLAAAVEALGAVVSEVGIAPDDPAVLEDKFRTALERDDVLVTTGGVSMGKYDLVGPALEAVGVQPVLHKVAVKPGKPIWFGLLGKKPVFGLPGNPVSSLLGFELFVRPSLMKMAGAGEAEQRERLRTGRWTGGATRPHWRQQNLPCRVAAGADGVDELVPLKWKGSADIVTMAEAEAFAVVEADAVLATGQMVEYRPLG